MSSKGISSQKIRSIMEKAAMHPMNVAEIFDQNICALIDNICLSSQMPSEYLITMLLPAVGHFVNGSQIRTNTGTPTNISFFTTIIGYPSVNKSSATEAILNACLVIEKHIGIKPEDSRVNCSATVESLLTELKNTSPKLIQICDEAVTLLQSFGLYKQGGAAYDRSIMCTLYNSSAVVKRQTKSGSVTVENPVLNIAAAAHPADIFSSVSGESDEDGLMARFLFSAPKPSIPLSSEIRPLNIDEPSLNHLLYIIYCFNLSELSDVRRVDGEDNRILYSYSVAAQKVIDDVFDEYTLQLREAYGLDQGLGSILGKAKVQVSRLAGALHAISLASAVFDQLVDSDLLPGYYDKSKEVFDILKHAVREFKESHKWMVVSEYTAQAAVVLMNYFVTQKKIYTNRPVHETLDEMRQRLEQKQRDQEHDEKKQKISAQLRQSKVSIRTDDGGEQKHPEKVILLAKGTKVPWMNIGLNHGGFKAVTLHQAAEKLQKESLGMLTKEKQTGAHRATTFFTKVLIDPAWDSNTLNSFCNRLAKYNVSYEAYQASTIAELNPSPPNNDKEADDEDNQMDASPYRERAQKTSTSPPTPPTITSPPPLRSLRTSVPTNRSLQNENIPPNNTLDYHITTPTTSRRLTNTTDATTMSNTRSPSRRITPPNQQPKKKNRIEPIDFPMSPMQSPQKTQ
ncbi:unnamed protein product, partial [Adineta ricciae]